MSVFPSWPWTNFHEYNLDWVIKTVKECKQTVEEAMTDVSNAVATYFADHIDATLTQSGEAADAAIVGGRLNTVQGSLNTLGLSVSGLGVRMTDLETAAPKTFVFELTQSAVPGPVDTLHLRAWTGKTEAETAALLKANAIANTGIIIAIKETTLADSYAYEATYDTTSHVLNFRSKKYRCSYNLDTATGSVEISRFTITVSGGTGSYLGGGNYASIDSWYLTDILILETGTPKVAYRPYAYATSGDTKYLYYANGVLECASDGTITKQ